MDEQVQPRGLSAAEVEERVARGEVNVDVGVRTRSVRQIVRENTLTLFNAINVILAVFVLVTGSYKNMLFMVVIVCNTAIGIVQEIRSKRTTDRLSIVASSKATVLRDGARTELPLDQLVRDDVIELGAWRPDPRRRRGGVGHVRREREPAHRREQAGEEAPGRRADERLVRERGHRPGARGARGRRELRGEDQRRGQAAQGRELRDHEQPEPHHPVRQLRHLPAGRVAVRAPALPRRRRDQRRHPIHGVGARGA